MEQQKNNYYNKFDTLLLKLSTDFINLSAGDLEKTVHTWMVEIALNLEAEIAVLFDTRPAGKLFISDYWRKDNKGAPVLYNPSELFPYLTSEILKGNLVIASSYEDLPEEAETDRLNLQKMGTSSFLFFPLGTDKHILGSFLFAYKTKKVSWDMEFVKKLRFIIQIFSSLIKNGQDKVLLEKKLQYESLLANLSRDFIAAKTEEIPDKITYWLHKAGETLKSDRALVFKLNKHNKFIMSTSWKSVDGKEVIPYDPEKLFPWMSTELRSGRDVIIPKLSAFPAEASKDKDNMGVIGSVSVLVLPLRVNNRMLGALAFSGTTENFQITNSLVQRFQIISQTFATALLRKETELKLAEEKERLAVTLKSIGDGVITTDEKGDITLLNDVAEKLTAWSLKEAMGKPVSQVFNIINEHTGKPQESPVEKVLKNLSIVSLLNHTLLIDKNGNKIPIADSGAPIKDSEGNILGVVLVFRDVTLEKKREEDILKLKKLESIGILAGGIAHDFNNILTGILGNINLASLETSKPEGKNTYLSNASRACKRAASLTQKLLTFSKGGTPVKENASLGEIITESMDFTLHGSQIKTVYSIPDNLWSSEVDRDQINQVIQNLALNSMESMVDGGKLTIDCRNITFKENHPRHGKYIEIKIKDTGEGISNENLDKIFDPYFSTKETGSGLGLAVTHSIIHKHDGFIDVLSKEGEGTEFLLYLPASKNDLPVSKPKSKKKGKIVKGSYNILIMDDEEMIRTMLTTLLTILGHKVITSCDGSETIEKYQNSSFDFVMLDITIPGGLGGIETIKQLKVIDPKIKAIVSSGYGNSPVISNYKDYGFCASLTKPYLLDELKTVIEKVMAP